MDILNLHEVSYTYRGKYQTVLAVNHVTTVFESGKLYAILGKSGSGKTTLLSLLGGLDLPTEGVIEYCGVPTSRLDLDRYRREELSIIYQSYNLFPLLNILENTMYPLMLCGVKKKDAVHAAEEKLLQVGLKPEQFKRYPSMLSGGEQQRVAIARALAAQPKVILADEPTGNLDVENGNNVVDVLHDLTRQLNYCVIIVTHDNMLAERADVILRMQDGKLISRQTAGESRATC